jgi:cytochrome c peroxidase
MKQGRSGRVLLTSIFAGLPLALSALVGVSYYAFADVPPLPPAPPQNPITEEKRVLGKILFFDEQLSSSNTIACATCHVMSRAGADGRVGTNPGPNGIFEPGIIGTDNRTGSQGVVRMDANLNYFRDTSFNFAAQVTGRAANSPINARFNVDSFWDGRARSQFVDPQTNTVAIPAGGSLESQAVGPITNSVEMGHDGVDWNFVTSKLANVQPLHLATNLPPDVAAVLASKPSYPQLFTAAFGDGAITARRIAFAIATYERTLISNQSPWDAFVAGNPNALTATQQAGLQHFGANCGVCHTVNNGLFTNPNLPNPLQNGGNFRNIGLRPVAEDRGRQDVTGNAADRGRFKVPSLRNVGLKRNFMHNGQFTTLDEVVRYYARAQGSPQPFLDNIDPAFLNINIPPQADVQIVDFLANGLLDPRVRDQQFPFDRPTLFTDSERAGDRPSLQGGGIAGAGGVIPSMLANQPGYVGNAHFRVGVFNALPGATARLYASLAAPIAGVISQDILVGTTSTGTTTGLSGVATMHWPLSPGVVTAGQVYFLQWVIDDPAALNGQALSRVARLPIFCGAQGCPAPCGTSDFNGDGDFGTDQDIEAFFACLGGNCCPSCYTLGSDFNGDGDFGTDQDIEAFFRVLGGGNC